MALVRVTAGLKSTILQLNQIINHLEGVAGNTLSWFLRTATNGNFIIVLGDDAGVSEFQLMDSNETVIFTINSNGDVTPGGAFSPAQIIVPGDVAPSQTDLGNLQLDEDGFFLTIGTGINNKRLGLVVGAGASPTLTGEMAYDTTSRQLLLHDGTRAVAVSGGAGKYVVTNQVITASTVFVDVVASGTPATMSFVAGANQIYAITLRLLLSYSTTGGFKLQLTGPAAPTRIIQSSLHMYLKETAIGGSATPYWSRGFLISGAPSPITLATAFFASDSAANLVERLDSATVPTEGAWVASGNVFEFRILYFNGANAGTVTVQVAQNSAAGTSTVSADSSMVAQLVGMS